MPRIRIDRPARLLPKDEPLADRRVHDPIDGEIIEEPLGHVNDAIRVLGLRRRDGALIDRASHVQPAAVLAGARVEIIPRQGEELATTEPAQERHLDDRVVWGHFGGQAEQFDDLGRLEVRARFPYRHLHSDQYPDLPAPLMLETVEMAAIKVPEGPDGPVVFTGRTATYAGPQESLDDGQGNSLRRGIPVSVSDGAAVRLARLPGVLVTEPTWHYRGGGCC